MSNETFDIGDTKRLRFLDLKNLKEELVDPDIVDLTVQAPSREVSRFSWPSESEILHEGTGDFAYHLYFTEAGVWQYAWVASGGIDLKEQGTLYVGVDTLAEPFPDDIFTVGDIWARSPALKAAYPKGSGDGDLSLLVATAAPLVAGMTGRAIAGVEGEAVPAGYVELAMKAIAMKAEQLDDAVGSASNRQEALERSRLRSISAGSWSESYWGPGEAAQGKQLDADPILASLLWALCTEERRGEWLELWSGKEKGFSVIESFDYSARPGGY